MGRDGRQQNYAISAKNSKFPKASRHIGVAANEIGQMMNKTSFSSNARRRGRPQLYHVLFLPRWYCSTKPALHLVLPPREAGAAGPSHHYEVMPDCKFPHHMPALSCILRTFPVVEVDPDRSMEDVPSEDIIHEARKSIIYFTLY